MSRAIPPLSQYVFVEHFPFYFYISVLGNRMFYVRQRIKYILLKSVVTDVKLKQVRNVVMEQYAEIVLKNMCLKLLVNIMTNVMSRLVGAMSLRPHCSC
jgi:hypothetical protein